MLGGEDHILHTSIGTGLSPLVGVEFCWIELVGQSEIPVHILLICACGIAGNPVFIADRPRLDYTRNGIKSPMEEYTELKVLPSFKIIDYLLFCRPLVNLRTLMNLVFLCACIKAHCQPEGKTYFFNC